MKKKLDRHDRWQRQAGFTLLELLAVLAIMGLMSGLAVMSFVSYKDGLALRQAVITTKTGIAQTRQWAITRRKRTQFRYGNVITPMESRGYYVVETSDGEAVGSTNWLSRGVVFSGVAGGAPNSLVFGLDGSLADKSITDPQIVEIEDKNAQDHNKPNWKKQIEILPLTGFARVKK